MNVILKSDQLTPGYYYYVRSKKLIDPETLVVRCGDDHGNKYLGNRIWATEENPQAFDAMHIMGPVGYPDWSRCGCT